MKILLIMNFLSFTLGWTTRRTFSRTRCVLTVAKASTSTPHNSTTTTATLPPLPENAHRMVLMRHGESEFNNANIFTGWCDVALTQRGVVEAIEAGQVFRSHELTFRKCYTSLLTRSIVTSHRSLEAAGVAYTPIQYDWRVRLLCSIQHMPYFSQQPQVGGYSR